MTPIETILTLQQFSNIVTTHHYYGKVIDEMMLECYNGCAFKDEVMSGGLRIFPKFVCERHSRITNKETK